MKLVGIFMVSFILLEKTRGSRRMLAQCYKHSSSFTKKKVATFEDASDSCQAAGGQLTSVHFQEENEFVISLLKSGGDSTGWLGVKFDDEVPWSALTRWRWADASPMNFRKWLHVQPSVTPGCGSLSANGWWRISKCEQLMAYVCKSSKDDCRGEGYFDHRRKRQAQSDDLYEHRAYKEYVQERLATTTTVSPELVRRNFEEWLSHQPMNTTNTQTASTESTSNFNRSQVRQATLVTTALTPLILNDSQTTSASYTAVVSSSSSDVTQSPSPVGVTSESSTVSQETGKSESISEVTKSSDKCSKFQGDTLFYEGRCYSLGPYRATWMAAKHHCKGQGGQLAVIDNQLQAEHLGSLSNSSIFAWFGLAWSNDSLSFQWVTGSSVNFTNWKHLEGGRDWTYSACVMVKLGETLQVGTWFKEECSNRHRYICQYNVSSHETTTTTTTTSSTTKVAIVTPTTSTTPTTTTATMPTTTATTTTTTTTATTTATTTTTTASPVTTSTTTRPTRLNLNCARGWNDFMNGNCYKIFTEPLPWDVAEAMCQTYGAHLLVLNDRRESQLLQCEMTLSEHHSPSHPMWVGLKMINNTEYQWIDGSTLSMTEYWAPGEPNTHDDRELCVQVTPRTYWYSTADCTMPQAFMCEAPEGMPLTTLPPPTPYPDAYCLDDHNSTQDNSTWHLYNGFCYKFVGNDITKGEKTLGWWDSHVKCRDNGGELASIHSLAENYWIMSKLNSLNTELVWIGGRALEDSGYSWLDDTPFDFVRWRHGEPNNIFDQEDCISMYARYQGYWNDQNCAISEGYICKRPYEVFYPPHQHIDASKGHCPRDWISTGTKCFKIFEEKMNIHSAIAACKNKSSSGNLASIHSDIEQAYLTSAMTTVKSSVWIGLKTHRYKFYWMDQTAVTYTNWAAGEPKIIRSVFMRRRGACAEMLPFHEAGRWNDCGCDAVQGFICQQHSDPNIMTPFPRPLCEAPQDNYIFYDGGCYRVVNRASPWKDAEETCRSEGSHLVSVKTISEAATVWVVVMENGLEEAWLGLRYYQKEEAFKWSNGWLGLSSYTQWGAWQPQINGSYYQCTKINATDGFWYTESCDQEMAFICKYENETTVPTPDTPVEGSCPNNNWHDFGGSYCYQIFSDEIPWKDANMRCLRENADLASIHSEEENDFLHKAAYFIKDSLWIGLLQKRDNYGWSDGTGFDFMAWRDQEPTNGREKCVEMYASDGKWNDNQCNNIRPFICKTRKIPSNNTEINTITGVTSEGLLQQHLTAAGTAGITLAIAVVVLLAGVAGYIYRKRTRRPPKIDGCYSFDNALYSADPSRTCELVDDSTVHFYHNDPIDTVI